MWVKPCHLSQAKMAQRKKQQGAVFCAAAMREDVAMDMDLEIVQVEHATLCWKDQAGFTAPPRKRGRIHSQTVPREDWERSWNYAVKYEWSTFHLTIHPKIHWFKSKNLNVLECLRQNRYLLMSDSGKTWNLLFISDVYTVWYFLTDFADKKKKRNIKIQILLVFISDLHAIWQELSNVARRHGQKYQDPDVWSWFEHTPQNLQHAKYCPLLLIMSIRTSNHLNVRLCKSWKDEKDKLRNKGKN